MWYLQVCRYLRNSFLFISSVLIVKRPRKNDQNTSILWQIRLSIENFDTFLSHWDKFKKRVFSVPNWRGMTGDTCKIACITLTFATGTGSFSWTDWTASTSQTDWLDWMAGRTGWLDWLAGRTGWMYWLDGLAGLTGLVLLAGLAWSWLTSWTDWMADHAGWTIWIDWLTELASFDWLDLFYQHLLLALGEWYGVYWLNDQ